MLIFGILLAACAPFNIGGNQLAQEQAAPYTPNPTYTALPPYPTYTSLPTYTALALPASNTPIVLAPTFTLFPTLVHYPSNTPFKTNTPFITDAPDFTSTPNLTNTPSPTIGTGTPSATDLPAVSLLVEVTRYKTVLREIKEYNKKGYPIMRVREPRIRYDEGDTIEVYAFGGEDGGPLYRSDGLDYYYKVYDSDGQEEELYVPSWHVAIVEGTVPTPDTPTPAPTNDGISLFVRVITTKTVLRMIESYNDNGYPNMIIREPRIRYEYGELIPVYATGGVDDGPYYFSDGASGYFRVYDSDGQEEELYVVSWHVEIVPEE